MTEAGRRWSEMVNALAGEPLALPVVNAPCRRFDREEEAERMDALLELVFGESTPQQRKELRAAAGIGRRKRGSV
ncbi:hypothetical protein HZU83_15110 [Sphaerotilus montanus]|uniref:Uncharacterized protein n=1 Tax=Sphaerotilus montanus TaxID=522889 RepID=A0A7Y9UAZ4_9BURK|nr:hypothetical protein [Sphaerotilus montanus]NYG31934.1 hypothetical protein [Sphaerotilus montanus]NZD58025.1 hypothetical protein [Sphaerotilus montanus]